MEIKPIDVKNLREKTGAGMGDCKKALIEAEGNIEQAIKILKEKGLAAAAKRSSRATKEGKIFTKIQDGKAVILELNCETDEFHSEADNAAFRRFLRERQSAACTVSEKAEESP